MINYYSCIRYLLSAVSVQHQMGVFGLVEKGNTATASHKCVHIVNTYAQISIYSRIQRTAWRIVKVSNHFLSLILAVLNVISSNADTNSNTYFNMHHFILTSGNKHPVKY